MTKLLSPRTVAFLGLLSLATGIGATLTITRVTQGAGECCYPGSPCCHPGAPCCQGRHRAG
ncbi:MAG: hypothetical protein IPN17_22335 [Deltaproteobacteria bacterium]|jgi:hypothetical protein|nr:hypothetical protein [Deltaproteobacteria bacterium]